MARRLIANNVFREIPCLAQNVVTAPADRQAATAYESTRGVDMQYCES